MAKPLKTTPIDLSGFNPSVANKVKRLAIILSSITRHPFLMSRVCLHGGTAINLFLLSAPRLSVDIDLNYIGTVDYEEMWDERPAVEEAVMEIALEQGYAVTIGKQEHAGMSFKLRYEDQYGADFIKIDLDYLNRSPLLSPEIRQIVLDGQVMAAILTNSAIELIGGKLKALLSRVVPRDLYDICRLAELYPALVSDGDETLMRRIMIYYSVLSDPFPKPFAVASRFHAKEREVQDILYPMLRDGERPLLADMIACAEDFIAITTTPKDAAEEEFVVKAAKAQLDPSLLFDDAPSILQAALADPAAKWKMQNLAKVV
ncbi:MAG: nucleotidyl transferase AbiEii/AbiGii toxin family protein [Coriobacteriales bacterium]|jgi:predicted nucleotidyltransferase component of viral defense system|nr:nucleotidyl transferase AbiEii/AbiGii toxin family protein [Coriobacteriales bacterium]